MFKNWCGYKYKVELVEEPKNNQPQTSEIRCRCCHKLYTSEEMYSITCPDCKAKEIDAAVNGPYFLITSEEDYPNIRVNELAKNGFVPIMMGTNKYGTYILMHKVEKKQDE